MSALIYSIVQLLHTVINLYIWIVIIASLLSFVKPDPHHPIVQALYRLTDPVLSYIREKLPFVVLSGIDLSPVVVVLGLQLLDNFMIRSIVG
ncbi:MAG: Integral membrane protein YggT, involved in response to extracytoplasmic stress (osmotic shock) [uncultured Sulfurovum sp.]|uniref:Integral membrane protein YggT, involved in response to extracytoplasmic stress (Osmotic shock) n=1 Tax=uncultured Sulfurovum sp. TaxID=269237 RepID=A0A6S6U494_9BACT|nr:MAG: Integral membrane protein YggT, involved in response to extracytoplasmic stress (osmotic shock) [uncultured Sulfurovum sp.]